MSDDGNPANAPMPAEPFRGIEPFRFMDRSIFFERKKDARNLTRLAIVYRGVLLYGGQGCGKSSLVNAGLVPAALEEGFLPERLRVQPVPGREIVVERFESGEEDSGEFLPSWLATESPKDVHLTLPAENLHQLIQNRPEDDFTPLIIFDQFEELITLFEEQPATKQAFDEAATAQSAILEAIHQLLIDEELPVKLLFVFREDYLGKLSKLLNRHPRLRDQSLRLLPPEATALEPIIAGPFETHPFDRPFSKEITQELCDAFAARSESGRVRLTEIQIACQTLWRDPNGPALFSEAAKADPVKAIANLLERYTEEAIASLPKKLRSPSIVLLSRLLTTSGTRNIVEENGLIRELVQGDHFEEDRARAALAELLQRVKLVRREIRNDTAFVEIASEFLVPWIKSQRSELDARRREKAANETARKKQAAQKEHFERQQQELKQKRLNAMMTVGGIALLLTTASTIYAINRARVAETQKTLAQEASAETAKALEQVTVAQKQTKELNEQLKAEKAEAEQRATLTEISLQESSKARAKAEETVEDLRGEITRFEDVLSELGQKTFTQWDQAQLGSLLHGFEQILGRVEQSQVASQQAERANQAILQSQALDLPQKGPPPQGPPPPPDSLPESLDAEASVIISAHKGAITGAAFGNRRPLLVTAALDNRAMVWNLTGRKLADFSASSKDGASCINFSPDDTRIVTGSQGRTVAVFDIDVPEAPAVLFNPEEQGDNAHVDAITSATFSTPSGEFVLSSSVDRSVKLWNSTDGSLLWSHAFAGRVNSAVLAPDLLFYGCIVNGTSAERNHLIYLGSTVNGEPETKLQLKGTARRAALDKSGQRFTCGTDDPRGAPVFTASNSDVRFLKTKAPVEESQFSPDGQRIATIDRNRVLTIWRPDGEEWVAEHKLETASESDETPEAKGWDRMDHLLAWSPDSARIAVSAQQKEASVWNIRTGLKIQQLKGHAATITSVLWQQNASGAFIGTTDNDGEVRLWLAPTLQTR